MPTPSAPPRMASWVSSTPTAANAKRNPRAISVYRVRRPMTLGRPRGMSSRERTSTSSRLEMARLTSTLTYTVVRKTSADPSDTFNSPNDIDALRTLRTSETVGSRSSKSHRVRTTQPTAAARLTSRSPPWTSVSFRWLTKREIPAACDRVVTIRTPSATFTAVRTTSRRYVLESTPLVRNRAREALPTTLEPAAIRSAAAESRAATRNAVA